MEFNSAESVAPTSVSSGDTITPRAQDVRRRPSKSPLAASPAPAQSTPRASGVSGPPTQPAHFSEPQVSAFPKAFLCSPRHESPVMRMNADTSGREEATAGWRLRPRMRTACGGIIMCLNVGTDPPDVVKPQPCAKQECWFDPTRVTRKKAKEEIGRRVLEQFEKLARARYKHEMDPTVDQVHHLCLSLRKAARSDRLLLHYNGHGVPKPTENGEVWVFNKSFTQYMPLAVEDLMHWVGRPAIFVFDCNAAGALMPFFDMAEQTADRGNAKPQAGTDDFIVLAACGAKELLPMSPIHPADLFTACLTTPIQVALRRFVQTNQMSMAGVTEDFVDQIPGRLNDRKTPLGELNWIFTAITDTVAWNTLPRPLFQRLFRQDLLLAALFRNFLFANRVFKGLGLTPEVRPHLPDTSEHPLWASWDSAVENCLFQLFQRRSGIAASFSPMPLAGRPADIRGNGQPGNAFEYSSPRSFPEAPMQPNAMSDIRLPPSTFFAEQLTACEVWLKFGRSPRARPPEQLPMVLQVLLSQAHRHRALLLLKQFLELGAWAVNLALSVGIFPYVLKLLKSPAPELCPVLVAIWARILCFDKSCQLDLVKPQDDHPLRYFLTQLRWPPTPSPDQSSPRAAVLQLPSKEDLQARLCAAFSLAQIMDGHRVGQEMCMRSHLHIVASETLHALSIAAHASSTSSSPRSSLRLNPNLSPALRLAARPTRHPSTHPSAQLRAWLCICISRLCHCNARSQIYCLHTNTQTKLFSALYAPEVVVRAASLTALSAFFSFDLDALPGQSEILTMLDGPSSKRFTNMQLAIGLNLVPALGDGSPLVRREALLGLTDLLFHPLHVYAFLEVVTLLHESRRERSESGSLPLRPKKDLGAVKEDKAVANEAQGKASREAGAPSALDEEVLVQEKLGEESVGFYKLWRAIQEARGTEPFPAVQKVIRDITCIVNSAILEIRRRPSGTNTVAQSRAERDRSASQIDIANIGKDDGPEELHIPPLSRHASDQGFSQVSEGAADAQQHLAYAPDEAKSMERHPLETGASMLVRFRHANRDALFHWLQLRFKAASPEQVPSDDGGSGSAPPVFTPDPLSLGGVLKLYLARRNEQTWAAADELHRSFQSSSAEPSSRIRLPSDPAMDVALQADEASSGSTAERLSRVRFDQSATLSSNYDMTSMLLFHPYETALVSADDGNRIGVWDYEEGRQVIDLGNGNAVGSTRMTSLKWINPETKSLLLVGSDDGVVRVWDGLLDGDATEQALSPEGDHDRPGGPSQSTTSGPRRAGASSQKSLLEEETVGARLVTAFVAVPDIVAGEGFSRSGLVSEWRQDSGTLTVGGSSETLRLWDLEQEQNIATWKSGDPSTCVTSMASVRWGSTLEPTSPNLGSGTSGCSFVAGYGNGALRLFDTRVDAKANPCLSMIEHQHWVVHVQFTCRSSFHELLSGSLAGEAKFWDLRYTGKGSIRTIEVQRSPMTALALHPCAPIMASGSHKQFIKILDSEGDQLGMIKVREAAHLRLRVSLSRRPCPRLL